MACSVYVYYRLRPECAAAARQAADALLDDMRRVAGIDGRLMIKRGEPLLWMEVYEAVADAERFLRLLAPAALRAGFDALLLEGTQRKIECFEAAPCA